MESLLSLSFDYLSSFDGVKIRKGLRQLEGLLAQICLTRRQSSTATSPISERDRRRSIIYDEGASGRTEKAGCKNLANLGEDPAFCEFFKLQEGFEWNVALRLVSCLERLLGKGSNGQNDLLLISTLDLLHGILLIHPPSRSLFARDLYMNLLLDLLDPSSCPAIQSTAILTLVTALLDRPLNTRCFEKLDGLLTVTSLFKARGTSREVKMKLVEFLYFYLMPETPSGGETRGKSDVNGHSGWTRSPSKVEVGGRDVGDEGGTRSTEEKQGLLGRYLSNVEDMVEDLKESAPFGASFG